MKQTKYRVGTALGVPNTSWEYRTGGPTAERVVVTVWHEKAVGQPVEYEAGTMVMKHMTGDGRSPNSVVHAECVIVDHERTEDMSYHAGEWVKQVLPS